MLNGDRAAKKAEELLPWEIFSCETADEETWQQLAYGIAAELREAYKSRPECARCGSVTHSRGEGDLHFYCATCWVNAQAEIARLRAELAKVKP